jgi:dTDP-4-amino-4,6-dideoxygalactose transaminase
VDFYDKNLDFSIVQKLRIRNETKWNYSYYPILFESEAVLLEVQKKLNENQIFPRRYFYPSLNTIPFVEATTLPISEDTAKRILCLPLYYNLEIKAMKIICKIINN